MHFELLEEHLLLLLKETAAYQCLDLDWLFSVTSQNMLSNHAVFSY